MNNAAEQQNAVTESTTTNWSQFITRDTSTHTMDTAAEVKRYWEFFVTPGKAVRIHIQPVLVPEGAEGKLMYGYFDNLADLTAAVSQNVESSRIYASLNCYEPDATNFTLNQVCEAGSAGVPEGKLTDCKHLLITPKLAPDVDQTADPEAILRMAREVAAFMSMIKYFDPAIIDSGNAIHLVYNIGQDDVFATQAVMQKLLGNMGEFMSGRGLLIDTDATQPSDLLDRCLLFELKRILASARTTESQLWHNFEQVRPSIMGGIFDTLSKAMVIYPTVRLTSLPRMADFAQWGCAIAEALGYTQDYFLAAYSENIESATRTALDSHPLATTILRMMIAETNVEANAGEMLARLETVADENHIRINDKQFPRNSAMLVRRINEVKSDLESDGIQISVTRDSRNTSVIKIFREAGRPAQEENA